MREWLNELLYPLQGKVDAITTSGIRTDIEKMVTELRREAKSALEANASLSRDREIASNATAKLQQENSGLKVQLQVMEQRLQGAKSSLANLDGELQDNQVEYADLLDLYEPTIDFGVLTPDKSWSGSGKEWVDKSVQQAFREFAKRSFKPHDVDDELLVGASRLAVKTALIRKSIDFCCPQLLTWTLSMSEEDLDKVLCLSFNFTTLMDKCINNAEAFDRACQQGSRYVNTVSDWRKNARMTLSEGVAELMAKRYGFAPDDSLVDIVFCLAKELARGTLVCEPGFKFRCKDELNARWAVAAIPQFRSNYRERKDSDR